MRLPAFALATLVLGAGCSYNVGHGKINPVVVERTLDLSRIPTTALPESSQFSMDETSEIFSADDAARYDKKYGNEVEAVEQAQLLLTEASVKDVLGNPVPEATLSISVAQVPLTLNVPVTLPGPLTGQIKAAIAGHVALSERVELLLSVPDDATHEALTARAVVQPIVIVNGLDAIQ